MRSILSNTCSIRDSHTCKHGGSFGITNSTKLWSRSINRISIGYTLPCPIFTSNWNSSTGISGGKDRIEIMTAYIVIIRFVQEAAVDVPATHGRNPPRILRADSQIHCTTFELQRLIPWQRSQYFPTNGRKVSRHKILLRITVKNYSFSL